MSSDPAPSLPPRFKRPMPTFTPFKEVEVTRVDFDANSEYHVSKTPDPEWKIGSRAPRAKKSAEGKRWIVMDPNDRARDPIDNYSLMISGYTPRPIAFCSTISKDGHENLAPFSYTTFVNHDPITIITGFSPFIKRTFRIIIDTGEAVVNLISEEMLEATNFSCIDSPRGTSEWGLTCKSMDYKILKNTEGQDTGGYAVLEGVIMHIREDALDADHTMIDQGVLKSVARLGGITYGRVAASIQLLRPFWSALTKEEKALTDK